MPQNVTRLHTNVFTMGQKNKGKFCMRWAVLLSNTYTMHNSKRINNP